jgi:O-antigen/teichoic acid export membrane protein
VVRAGSPLAIATGLANVLGYAVNLVLSRALSPGEFGTVGALFAIVLVAAVPSVAVQTVVARRTAAGVAAGMSRSALALRVGGTQVAVLAAAAPLLDSYLHVRSPGALVAAVATVLPYTVFSAALGAVQGAQRFTAYGGLFLLVNGLRLLAAAGCSALDGGVATAAALNAVAVALASVVAAHVARSVVGDRNRPTPTDASSRSTARPVTALREVAVASVGIGGILVLGNVDVLLANHYLPGRSAGLYAAGSVLAKAAYWAPQFLLVLALPRMAADRRGHRAALVVGALLLVVGATGTLLTAVAGRHLTRLLFGSVYGDLAGYAWAFVAAGSLLGLAHLVLLNDLARARAATVVVLSAAVVAEVGIVTAWAHGSPAEIVSVTLGVTALTTLTGALVALAVRGAGRRATPAADTPG